MARATRDGHFGFEPLTAFFNAIVWISAVICMGILSYFISLDNHQGSHVIYEEVIAVLTVAFFLVTFFIGATGHLLLFNLIFSYLWLVSVVFTANDWTYSHYPLAQTVEAFSFIAFFFLLFNVVYHWHIGYGGARTTTSRV